MSWLESGGLWMSSITAGGTAGTPTEVVRSFTTLLGYPDAGYRLAVAPSGQATFIWDDYDGLQERVVGPRRAPGPIRTITRARISTSMAPVVAGLSDGTTIAGWTTTGGRHANSVFRVRSIRASGLEQTHVVASETYASLRGASFDLADQLVADGDRALALWAPLSFPFLPRPVSEATVQARTVSSTGRLAATRTLVGWHQASVEFNTSVFSFGDGAADGKEKAAVLFGVPKGIYIASGTV